MVTIGAVQGVFERSGYRLASRSRRRIPVTIDRSSTSGASSRSGEGDISLLKGPRFRPRIGQEKAFFMRKSTIKRKTKETDIEVTVNLDGSGASDVATGIGFFDHMLDLLARHSRIDITVKAVGDLHIDHHHTTEDVGIALGQAMKQALGTMAGITRYASVHMPMDETLSRVVIDISGRPVLVFKVEFPRDKVGQFDTELVREWFNAFAVNAGVTLHVETLYGENSHHIAESCFKGLARALRAAVAIDPRAAGEVPSTKGQLGG
jgi:imidazoleglycerol-phosphate dehydratase